MNNNLTTGWLSWSHLVIIEEVPKPKAVRSLKSIDKILCLPCAINTTLYFNILHCSLHVRVVHRSVVDIIYFFTVRVPYILPDNIRFVSYYIIFYVCYFPDFSRKKIMNKCIIRLPLSVSEESSYVKITECVSHPSGKISTPSHRVRDVCFRNTRARLVRRYTRRVSYYYIYILLVMRVHEETTLAMMWYDYYCYY